MSKKLLIFLTLTLLVAFVILVFTFRGQNVELSNSSGQKNPEPTQAAQIKASFEIYTYGTKRIFTETKYHNQSQDVYIEGSDPSVIFVKKEGITWDDFFKTLPMSLSKDCLVTGTQQTFCTGESGVLEFVLNGQVDPDALQKEIRQGDNLQVNYGG